MELLQGLRAEITHFATYHHSMSPNSFREEECGTVTIQAQSPRTPQVIERVQDITLLSSPIDRYAFKCTNGSPITARFHHKASDRSRCMSYYALYLNLDHDAYLHLLQEAKGSISSLEDRLRVIKEEMRAIKEEREERRTLILEWETCDRLPQGVRLY